MKTLKLLSDDEKDFIRSNYEYMTRIDMAKHLVIQFRRVDDFCRTNKLIRRRVKFYKKKEVGIPKSNIQRPPAVYSNISREQHINKWLNAAL